MNDSSRSQMLTGYRVLDFSQYIAGPTTTRMMAGMGAEVLKLELAPGGDRTRGLPYIKNGRSGYYIQQNVGKKSLCLDAKSPAGLAIIKELVPKVDCIVENFAPGVLARMGLSYEAARTLNPAIVMCSISTFGQTGPLAPLPGYDFIAQAYSGITSMIGETDGPPFFPMAAVGDVSTGITAALAIVAALLNRERTSKGQYIDISLLDTYFNCHHTAVQMYSLSAGNIKLTRSGKHLPYGAPCSMYRGHEHYIIIVGGLEHQWLQLCHAMGRPELAEDARFRTNADRVEHQNELFEIIQGWITSLPSEDVLMAKLNEYRVPAAPVLSIEEAINHPHLRARGTVNHITDPVAGELEIPGYPLRFSEFATVDLPAPLLGQHNREILHELLGYPSERINQLERHGVIVTATT